MNKKSQKSFEYEIKLSESLTPWECIVLYSFISDIDGHILKPGDFNQFV